MRYTLLMVQERMSYESLYGKIGGVLVWRPGGLNERWSRDMRRGGLRKVLPKVLREGLDFSAINWTSSVPNFITSETELIKSGQIAARKKDERFTFL